MSARYLGELGKPEDADLLVSRIAAEQDNPYVVAELCIAGLKLSGPPRSRGSSATSSPCRAFRSVEASRSRWHVPL
jgi:hypothetical protein